MNAFAQKRLAAAVIVAGGAALLWSGDGPSSFGSFITQAQARIGRPATPMSYAGVARRTTRRAVTYGAAGAAAAGAYYYATPGCRQVVDSYGHIVVRCP